MRQKPHEPPSRFVEGKVLSVNVPLGMAYVRVDEGGKEVVRLLDLEQLTSSGSKPFEVKDDTFFPRDLPVGLKVDVKSGVIGSAVVDSRHLQYLENLHVRSSEGEAEW